MLSFCISSMLELRHLNSKDCLLAARSADTERVK